MPSAITVMPSASLKDSMAFKMPWLRGRLWMSVMKERSLLISSAVISASAEIVDRNPDAELPEDGQDLVLEMSFCNECILGDFDDKTPRATGRRQRAGE